MNEFLSKIPVKTIVVIIGIIALGVLIYFASSSKNSRSKPQNTSKIKSLVFGALCIALAFVLSNIRLFRMPQGGSITPASMLPIILYAFYFGPKYGFIASIAYALLQYMQNPFFLNFPQFMLDYIIGFGILGVASLFKNFQLATLMSGSLRMLCSFLSGVIFFAEYVPAGTSPVVYSLLYQLSSIGIETLICFTLSIYISSSKTFKKAIDSML